MGMKRLLFIIIIVVVYLFTPPHSFSQKKMDVFKVAALYNKSIDFYKNKEYNKSIQSFKELLKYLPSEAGFYLGEQFYYGLGVPENLEEALKYYQIAAEAGEPISQQKLASYYFNDETNIRDRSLAFYWNRVASTNPDGVDCDDAGKCAYQLACCYKYGIGTNINSEYAELWIAMSAILDYTRAQDYLEEKYNLKSDWETDAEELAYQRNLTNHYYSLIIPKISNVNSLEARTVKCLYFFQNQKYDESLSLAKSLYDDKEISVEGKKNIGELLIAYYRDYKNDKYNAELIEEELSKLSNIDELNYKYWLLQQYTICLSKIF